MPTTYSQEFKQAAVEKLLARGNHSLEERCEQLGISRATGHRWATQFAKQPGAMHERAKGKRSQEYSAEQKCDAVMEFRRLRVNPQAQGEFLRKQGLHSATVETWEKEALQALEKHSPLRRPKRTKEEIERDEKIKCLERDVRRKDRALAETTALLVLKKKAESIWGLVDDEESA